MRFFIEQIALAPADPAAAIALLRELGLTEWIPDHVRATGFVAPVSGYVSNEADLTFNYQSSRPDGKPLELEILHYTSGINWIGSNTPTVSHLGVHCTAEELVAFSKTFARLGIPVAQQVNTDSHTNPAIKDTRRYTYVIFNTRPILGTDLKFIVRRDI